MDFHFNSFSFYFDVLIYLVLFLCVEMMLRLSDRFFLLPLTIIIIMAVVKM